MGNSDRMLFVGMLGLVTNFSDWEMLPYEELDDNLYCVENSWRRWFREGTEEHTLLSMVLTNESDRLRCQEKVQKLFRQAIDDQRFVQYTDSTNSLWEQLNDLLSRHGLQEIGRRDGGIGPAMKRLNPSVTLVI